MVKPESTNTPATDAATTSATAATTTTTTASSPTSGSVTGEPTAPSHAAAAPAAAVQQGPPVNVADFWRRLDAVVNQPSALAPLLAHVAPSRLRGYLDNQLEPEHAAGIVAALAHMVATMRPTPAEAAAEAYKRLRALTRTPRLEIALDLLDDEVRAATGAAAGSVCDAVLQHVGDRVKPDEVAAVRKAFAGQ